MGGLTSVMSTVMPVVNTVGRIASVVDSINVLTNRGGNYQQRAENDQALQQLQERQALQMQQMEQDNDLARQNIALEAQQSEDQRRAALRRAVSRQRAQFGSQGIGSAGGSSDAVLLGFFDESEAELKRREQLDQMKSSALDLGLSQSASLNLLQASQLAERQKLARLF